MNVRKSVKVAAFGAAMLGLMVAPSLGRVAAQEATPEPVDLVTEMVPCGEWLGLGDETVACVVILHLSPDAPAVDIWVNGAVAVPGLEYGKDTGYIALPAGDYAVAIAPAGAMASDADYSVDITLEAGMVYHAAAMGTLAAEDEAEFGVKLYERQVGAWEGEGTAIVEVIHASTDAPSVDVATKGGDAVITDLVFGEVSDDLALPAGTYDLEVRPTGTMDVALDLPGVALEAGKIYTVYAVGTLNADDEAELGVHVVVTEQKAGM